MTLLRNLQSRPTRPPLLFTRKTNLNPLNNVLKRRKSCILEYRRGNENAVKCFFSTSPPRVMQLFRLRCREGCVFVRSQGNGLGTALCNFSHIRVTEGLSTHQIERGSHATRIPCEYFHRTLIHSPIYIPAREFDGLFQSLPFFFFFFFK